MGARSGLDQSLQGALERGAVLRLDAGEQLFGKVEGDGGHRPVEVAPSLGEREKGLARVSPVGPPRDQLAFFQMRHGPRDLRFVHATVHADSLRCKRTVFAKHDDDPPFGDADLVAVGVDAGERLANTCRADVEPMRQERFQLQRPSLGLLVVFIAYAWLLHWRSFGRIWVRVQPVRRAGVQKSASSPMRFSML